MKRNVMYYRRYMLEARQRQNQTDIQREDEGSFVSVLSWGRCKGKETQLK